jgi:hypothetical protein
LCKTVKNKNKQNVLHMFALQHFILPKVIGYLFHLHFYLFNSQKRIYLNTKKEISKDKKGSIKRQKGRYQKTKKRNKQTTLFFLKCNPLISFISIYKLFYSYTSSIPNSSKPVSVLAHGSKCGGRLNVASLS